MAARTLLVLAVLGLLPICVGAQPNREKRQIGPDEIKALQEQLAAIAALQGKTPEELEKLLKLFEGKFGDLPDKFPNGIPKPPPIGPKLLLPPKPPQIGPPEIGRPPDFEPAQPGGNPFNPPQPNGFNPGVLNQRPQFDPRMNEHPGVAEMAKFWEQNFGPLDKTPAVRDALIELFEMSKDGKLMDGEWKGLMDELKMDGRNADGMADWFKEMNFNGGKWNMPDWGKGWDMNWGGGRWGGGNWGSGRWGGGNWGGGRWGGGNWGGGGWGSVSLGGAGGSWLPVILLVAFAVIGLIVWKFWPMIKNRESSAAVAVRSLNRWPVDPRTINSRDELVRAFEYLSVLLCGDAARVWNHLTIARALRQQIPASELVADELARLYELARYTPVNEPLSPTSLAEARRCLCQLAGVST